MMMMNMYVQIVEIQITYILQTERAVDIAAAATDDDAKPTISTPFVERY